MAGGNLSKCAGAKFIASGGEKPAPQNGAVEKSASHLFTHIFCLGRITNQQFSRKNKK
jgi:hypothetical protein